MSLAATNHVFQRRYGNQIRKLLMLAIADFANEAGESWPSIDTLADRAECSRRSVQEHLQVLRDRGDLVIIPNAGRGGTNLYRIVFSRVARVESARRRGAALAPGVQGSGGLRTAGGANGGPPVAPESSGTSHEPSEKSVLSRAADEGELMARVNALRPATWQRVAGFTAVERQALAANRAALASIDLADWPLMARYLAARLPEGHPGWQPVSRLRFLEAPGDLLAHALEWQSRQRVPLRRPAVAAPEPSGEPTTTWDRANLREIFRLPQAAPP